MHNAYEPRAESEFHHRLRNSEHTPLSVLPTFLHGDVERQHKPLAWSCTTDGVATNLEALKSEGVVLKRIYFQDV